jgi:MinD-like ATPase involved in chromosome partitioning or flagellar assembly
LSTIHQHGSVRNIQGLLADAVVIDEGAGISEELKAALLDMTARGTFVFLLGGQN